MVKKFLLERPKNCLFQESIKFPSHESKRFLLIGLKASFSKVGKVPSQGSKRFLLKGLKGSFSRGKGFSSQGT